MRNYIVGAASLLAVLAGPVFADDDAAHADVTYSVSKEHVIDLGAAFPDVDAAADYTFRARLLRLAPGARTERIDHDGHPAITHVTEGEVLEHRDGAAAPLRRAIGDTTFDRASVAHYWENPGDAPAELLVVDVIPDPVG